MKDRKKKKLHLRKRTKQLIAIFCVLFVGISAGLTISSVRKNSLVSNTAYLNRFNISDEDKDNHEAVTDINGETPNEFAAKVKEANQSDTGNESKVIVNAPLGNEEKLADMVKDKNAVSYDSYTVVRFSDDDDNDKSLFINNMKAEKFDYQDDGMVQIAGIGKYPVTSFDKDAALPASDTPAKDAHDQGKLLVAVIDTGCGTEADSSVNFTTDSDMDNNGHGTAMARIIKEKSEGKAYILSLKAIGDNGEGTISNVTAAVKYAIEQGADIINMSIIAKDSENMAAFKSVVEDATMRSIKVVAAAGNFSDDVSNYVPANVTGVISVGAVTEDGMIADFSNYGKSLTMSVKGADSTSEATAIVAGYLAGSKKLGSQSDIAGNYTENPKNSGKDIPEKDSSKFKVQIRFAQSISLHINGKGHASITIDDGHDASASQGNDGFISSDAFTDEVNNHGRYWYPSTSVAGAWFTEVTPDYGYHFSTVTFENPVGTHNARMTHTGGADENSTYNRATYYPDAGTYDFVLCGENDGWSGTLGGAPARGTDSGYVPDTDGKLTVNFMPNSGTYQFDGNGGTAKESAVVVTYDSQTNNDRSAYIPTRTNCKFTGWYTASEGGTQVYDANGIATNGTGYWNNGYATWPATNGAVQTLYAHWETLLDVNHVNYQSNGQMTYSYGALANTAMFTGQPVSAWDAGRTPFHYAVQSDYSFNDSYGQPSDYITFTVGVNGSKVADKAFDFADMVTPGTSIQLSNISVPAGYKFLGYDVYKPHTNDLLMQHSQLYQNLNITTDFNGRSIFIATQGVSYNVDFNINAKNYPNDPQVEMPYGTMGSQTLHYGELESLKENQFVWPGHTFLGWSTNPNATQPDTISVYVDQGIKKTVTLNPEGVKQKAFWNYFGKDLGSYAHQDGASITLYAVWEPENATVKVNPNGGTWNGSASTQSITQKWGSTKNLGTPTAPSKTATVSFDLNFDPTDPNKAENEAKPHSPTPSSVTLKYVFKNWTVNSGGKGYMKGNVYTFQSTNDTVTANYYFQNLTLPTVTREGYTFLGWYREEGCLHKAGNAGYTEYRPEKNETLYARWRKDTYTYKDTIEVTDTDTKDSNPERSLLIRKTDTYGTVLIQKGFTIGIYKQNMLGGLGDKVYELRTGEGLYQGSTLVDGTADGNGYYELKNPAAGKYVAHEEEAPAGWFMSDDYKFVVAGTSGERVTVDLEDGKITRRPPTISVKLDSFGRAITDAVFELKDTTSSKVIGTYSVQLDKESGISDFPTEMYESLQANHSYTLTETNPPDGFEKATYSFDVPRTGTNGLKAISILESVKTAGQLKIKKVDSTDKPLKGAEFQLFMKDEKGTLIPCMMDKSSGRWTNAAASDNVVPMKGTTDDGGTITWMNLPLRASFTGSEPDFCKSYYLVETKAPEGYSLNNKVIEIRLDENAKDKTVTYTVKDGRVTVTLDAGGNGIAWYTGIGVTVLAAALLLAVHAKRKQAE